MANKNLTSPTLCCFWIRQRWSQWPLEPPFVQIVRKITIQAGVIFLSSTKAGATSLWWPLEPSFWRNLQIFWELVECHRFQSQLRIKTRLASASTLPSLSRNPKRLRVFFFKWEKNLASVQPVFSFLRLLKSCSVLSQSRSRQHVELLWLFYYFQGARRPPARCSPTWRSWREPWPTLTTWALRPGKALVSQVHCCSVHCCPV